MTDYYALAYIIKTPDATTPANPNLIGPKGSVSVADSNGGLTSYPTFMFNSDVSPNVLGVTGTIKTSQLVFDASNVRIGIGSGQTGQASTGIAIGYGAGQYTQGANAIAIGQNAGYTGQGIGAIAIGQNAGYSGQGVGAIAIGQNAGYSGQGVGAIAIGQNAGQFAGQTGAIAIGFGAGQYSQSANSIAIGQNAGQTGQSAGAIAIGFGAGQTGQGVNAIAIGQNAGQVAGQTGAIAIGFRAGQYRQSVNAIAIGQNAGQTGQGVGAIAIGFGAGQTGQGANAIAIGQNAGQTGQGAGAIAIGLGAGQVAGQTGAIAVGVGAGQYKQSTGSIAIGYAAGQTGQGANAIAIGYGAGQTGQGQNAIAIGFGAGQTGQAANSIVMNASGVPLNAPTPSALYVKPIRAETTNFNSYTQLSYNSATSEVVSFPASAINKNLTENFSVAGGAGANQLGYSYDGFNWLPSAGSANKINTFTDGSCNAVGWNGSAWVAGGAGENPFLTSSDGINWLGNTGNMQNVLDSGSWRNVVDISLAVVGSFGTSLAIASLAGGGTRLAVGNPGINASYGLVSIYDYSINSDTWVKIKDLSGNATQQPSPSAENFGQSVALSADGNSIIIGASTSKSTGSIQTGYCYYATFNGSDWSAPAIGNLIPPIGQSIVSDFGKNVVMNAAGTRALVGAWKYNTNSGYVASFDYNNGAWTSTNTTYNTLQNPNSPTNPPPNVGFGWSVAMNGAGTRCIIGQYFNASSVKQVSCFDFTGTYPNGYWGTQNINKSIANQTLTNIYTASALLNTSNFGYSVAMDYAGLRCAIGAPGDGSSILGRVYIFDYGGSAWSLSADLSGNVVTELFGWSVALNNAGTRLVVGAKSFINGSTTTGRTYVYNYDITSLSWVPEPVTALPLGGGGTSSNSGALAGSAVAIDPSGNHIVSGAPSYSSGKGIAYVYSRKMQCNALSWNGSVWNAGGIGITGVAGPLTYSSDGSNWQKNSINTGAGNTLTQTFIGQQGPRRYYAYATALNAAGTRLAVLAGGSGDISNNTVTCYVYDMGPNGVWPLKETWNSFDLGWVKYMGAMSWWGYPEPTSVLPTTLNIVPGINPAVNMGCTPVAFNAAGDRLAVGVNWGPTLTGGPGTTNKGFVNIYHYNYSTNTWPNTATRQYTSSYAGSLYDYFGTSVAFNASGNRIFISSVYNLSSGGATTTGYVKIYDIGGDGLWPVNVTTPPNNSSALTLFDSNSSQDPIYSRWTSYGASIATNAAGNRLVVGAPSIIYVGYIGYVYLYHLTSSGWVNTPVCVYTMDSISGNYTGGTFGASVSMNAAGDRIAIGEPTEFLGNTNGQAGYITQGRAYIIDYNNSTNAWPVQAGNIGAAGKIAAGLPITLAKDVASAWYVGGIESFHWFGTCVKLNAIGDRLLISQPYNSDYYYDSRSGVIFILDYNYETNSWPTNYDTDNIYRNGMVITGLSGPGFSYIVGSRDQCLGNSLAMSADGNVLALGSPQAATFAGMVNLYNFKTKIGLTAVNALASNGSLVVAGGVGTNTIFATSNDGITFNNSVSDASGVLFNGSSSITNTGVATLISIIENPTNTTGNYFGGHNTGLINPGAVSLNAAGTIMAVGARGYGGNFGGRAYIYTSTLYGPWRLTQTIDDPSGNTPNQYFGECVGLNASGSILVVTKIGANSVLIYGANSTFTNWSLLKIINGPTGQIEGFGKTAVFNALGNVLIVGATDYDTTIANVGQLYAFRANAALTNWTLDASFNNPNNTANDYFGHVLATNAAGNVMAAGMWAYPNNKGRVYIYRSTNGVWTTTPVNTLTGVSNNDYFGNCVSFNAAGTILAVGSYAFSASANFGRVYVYTTTDNWSTTTFASQQTGLTSGDYFGAGLALNASGDTLIVDAPGFNANGRVYVYKNTNNWSSFPTALPIDGAGGTGGWFGNHLAINGTGDVFACGSPTYNTNTGRVYTYTYNNTITLLNQRTCKALATNGLIWVAGGQSTTNPLAWSNDGSTWVPSVNGSLFSGNSCNAVAWNGTRWVAGGSGTNPLAYSQDGKTWFPSILSGTSVLLVCNAVAWNGTYWLASGTSTTGSTQAYSPDGITWAVSNNSDTALFSGGNGLALAVRKTPAKNTSLTNQQIAIGLGAGQSNQQSKAIAIGFSTGQNNQQYHAVAIGYNAGQNYQQGNAVAIGYNAGKNNQQTNSVAIGALAGQTNQQVNAIAIGLYAGQINQTQYATAVGVVAGQCNQGNAATAIGLGAGSLNQGNYSVAVGYSAGEKNQKAQATAVGFNAGQSNQNFGAVAIGQGAGLSNQGVQAVAIGQYAGINNQHNNSIVINATGVYLNSPSVSSCVIAPMRNETTSNNSNKTYLPLYYNNNGTGELVTLPNQLVSTLTLANNTGYQNTTTRIQIVSISAYLYVGALLRLFLGQDNIGYFEVDVANNPSSTSNSYVTGTAFIPVGWYFKYTISSGEFNFARIIG